MRQTRRSMASAAVILPITALLALSIAIAATPPAVMNYQGVLRNATDQPLTGSYDMTFRFWSASIAGDEILVDQHISGSGGQVAVSGGLFDATLGGGVVSDGAGPGAYTSLSQVFRDYTTVWLSIQIGAEVLSPRVQVVSAGYAMNASYLEGKAASSLLDTTVANQTKTGRLIVGTGSGSGSAYGVEGYGIDGGGYFKDSDSTGYAKLGSGDYGVLGYGVTAGGRFFDLDSSAEATLASSDTGVTGVGFTAGGFFSDGNNQGFSIVGYGDTGIVGKGYIGGEFDSPSYTGSAKVGYFDYGINAEGSYTGGFFKDSGASGEGYAGVGDYGIQGYGNTAGGHFADLAFTGSADVGYFDYGIWAKGSYTGGYFEDTNASGEGYAGTGDYGIQGYGNSGGAYFGDSNNTGVAYVGYGDRGIWGRGTFAGATFSHPDTITFWADVATPVNKIKGTGTVSFVQNHPDDPSKVIVYAAPEGDEVAVYTRGTARLVDGEAHVKLGETFALVANPDIGLTAHVTPTGGFTPLSVEEKSTSELLVRGPAGSSAEFDYLVYGLRIGFERHPVVQARDRDAFLPDPVSLDALGASDAELSQTSALARFESMRTALGDSSPVDQTRAAALVARIDTGRDTVLARAAADEAAEQALTRPVHPGIASKESARGNLRVDPPPNAAVPVTSGGSTRVIPSGRTPLSTLRSADPPVPDARTWMPVSESVEAGDLLTVDPGHPGSLRRAQGPDDTGIAGIASGPSEVRDGSPQAPLFDTIYARMKVDASEAAIAPGDLLVASTLQGHAMRAKDAPRGAVIGKALEEMKYGQGLIRVLILAR